MIDSDHPVYERPGFLTTKDRDFLEGPPEDINDHAQKRRRIRQRTRSAFRDFSLVFENLPDKDRELIFEELADPEGLDHMVREESQDGGLTSDLSNLIAFICMGISDHTPARLVPNKGHRFDWFEGVVREGFEKAYHRLGYVVWHVDFDVSSADEELMAALKKEVKSRAASGVEPSSEKVKGLIDAGEIDRDALRQFLVAELDAEE